jgi:hypothetical protein
MAVAKALSDPIVCAAAAKGIASKAAPSNADIKVFLGFIVVTS